MSGSIQAAIITNATALGVGLQAIAEAVRTACADPADAIGLLTQLAGYTPTALAGGDAIGAAMTAAQNAVAACCRRAALASLARATSQYQPTSYQDAVQLRSRVCTLIDAEALIAGDTGDYATYTALRALRAAVVQDLTQRAASLSSVVPITRAAPLPALVIAYQLYGDAARYDDLVSRVDPISPLFMPVSFEALAS